MHKNIERARINWYIRSVELFEEAFNLRHDDPDTSQALSELSLAASAIQGNYWLRRIGENTDSLPEIGVE